jgi:hypothetical protein
MSATWIQFPPGLNHISVPATPRYAALAGMAMYAPCRPRSILMLRLAWFATSVAGPSVMPGRRFVWQPPVEAEVWNGITEYLRTRIGPFDTWAIYSRPQSERTGISALLLQNKAVCFAKVASVSDA